MIDREDPLRGLAAAVDEVRARGEGTVGRCADAGQPLDWAGFNELLASHHLTWLAPERIDHVEDSRLEVWRDGCRVPSSELTRTVTSMSNARSHRLDDAALRDLVATGAIIVLGSVHELHDPIGRFADGLSRVVLAPVTAAVVADCTGRGRLRRRGAAGRHRLVVQLAGRQQVQVEPDPSGSGWTGSIAQGEVVVVSGGSDIVTSGDRGQPSLHLELAVHDPSPADVFDHLVAQVADTEAVRSAVPRFASGREIDVWLATLRGCLVSELDDDFLHRFIVDRRERARSQQMTFSLPWSGTAEVLPSSGDLTLRWVAPPPQPRPDGIVVGGEHFGLAQERVAALAPLFGGVPVAATDLHPDGLGHVPTREVLISWILLGHVEVLSSWVDRPVVSEDHQGEDHQQEPHRQEDVA